MDRRAFLVTSAAAAAATAIPVGTIVAQPLTVKPTGFWGLSTNDDIYYDLGTENRAEAIAEALGQYPEGGVAIAWCEPVPVTASDLRDAITNHMAGDDSVFEYMIVSDLECGIEDSDYEGDMASTLCSADRTEIVRDIRQALNLALVRAGRPDLIDRDFYEEPMDSDDPVFAVLDKDEVLGAETVAAGMRWFARINLEGAGSRTLTISDEHHLPETEAA